MPEQPAGSAARWGALFDAGAATWAETWEGPHGWGTPVYAYVLSQTRIGPGIRVLDCGCGAGRFVRLATERGARVAGIDASRELVDIAAQQCPDADLRVGDFQALPWPDRTFDVVTAFSTMQFADDHATALAEAMRVSRGEIWVVVPTQPAESGIARVFSFLADLFPAEDLASLRHSGIFALSAPGILEQALSTAGLRVLADETVAVPVVFADVPSGVRAFLSAGATALAVRHAGLDAVKQALTSGLGSFADAAGQVVLPGWFRVMQAGPAVIER